MFSTVKGLGYGSGLSFLCICRLGQDNRSLVSMLHLLTVMEIYLTVHNRKNLSLLFPSSHTTCLFVWPSANISLSIICLYVCRYFYLSVCCTFRPLIFRLFLIPLYGIFISWHKVNMLGKRVKGREDYSTKILRMRTRGKWNHISVKEKLQISEKKRYLEKSKNRLM